MERFNPNSPVPLYWLRVPLSVIRNLRTYGFHDGYTRQQDTDIDHQVARAFAGDTQPSEREAILQNWVAWIDRESCLLNRGYSTLWHPQLQPGDHDYIRKRFAKRLIEIHADTVDEALHVFRISKWNFGIFYHVACLGHWRGVVREHFGLLERTGLNGVHISILGSNENRKWLEREAESHHVEISVDYHHIDPRMFEVPAIRLVQDWATVHDGYVLYFHTKGVSQPNVAWKQQWRMLMNHFVIEKWRQNAELLRDDFDVVGVNWRNLGAISHFPGNFWMANTRYLRTLEDFSLYYRNPRHKARRAKYKVRVGPEFWIGSSSTQARVYSHFTTDKCFDNPSYWSQHIRFSPGREAYLGLCLFVKDEEEYLQEWLDYHLSIGVEHIIVYDNNSQRSLECELASYIKRGYVTVENWHELNPGRQCRAYSQCLADYGDKFFWIGFIDTDEFIVPKNSGTLSEFLRDYEEFGGLGIFWYCFGSNHHLKKPAGGSLKSFTRRSTDEFALNTHIKTIVNTRFTRSTTPLTPHAFHFQEGYFAVDEYKSPIFGPRRKPRTSDLIQLNHYIFRSFEEFQLKLLRGGGNSRRPIYKLPYFKRVDPLCCEVEDLAILGVLDKVSNRLANLREELNNAPRPTRLPDMV